MTGASFRIVDTAALKKYIVSTAALNKRFKFSASYTNGGADSNCGKLASIEHAPDATLGTGEHFRAIANAKK